MTNEEAMYAGKIYDPNDDSIMSGQLKLMEKMYDYNATRPSEQEKRAKLLKEMFAECGENCYVEPPFYANWGGAHVHFGNQVYANFGLTCVDDTDIYVDDCVMFGPHCIIATPNHPILPELRIHGWQYNKPVHIKKNAWLGAGVIVVPGVTIGENAVIGAGSVVTKDIPDGVVAVGVPCRVVRDISDHDREYFYKSEKIDWDRVRKMQEEAGDI